MSSSGLGSRRVCESVESGHATFLQVGALHCEPALQLCALHCEMTYTVLTQICGRAESGGTDAVVAGGQALRSAPWCKRLHIFHDERLGRSVKQIGTKRNRKVTTEIVGHARGVDWMLEAMRAAAAPV
jgi:hypothetical protein